MDEKKYCKEQLALIDNADYFNFTILATQVHLSLATKINVRPIIILEENKLEAAKGQKLK